MSKDELNQQYERLSERTAAALEGLQQAILEMNEQNILHTQTLQRNTEAVLNIKEFWGTIVKWLVIALIVLAGAEKVGHFLLK